MTPKQIRAIPGWEDAADGEINNLFAVCAERWHRVGAMLIDGAKPAIGAMMIVSGELQTMFEVGNMALPIETLGVGDWVGTVSTFEDGAELFSVRAVTESRVLVLTREGLDRMKAQPSPTSLRIQRAIVKSMHSSLAKLAPLVSQVQRLNTEKRKHTKADLIALGFARLTQTAQIAASRDGPAGRGVELVQHDGVAIAATFRAMR